LLNSVVKDSLFETQEQPVAMAAGDGLWGNRFAVESLIGNGSSRVLFRAKDRVNGISVALKILSPLEREPAERFLSEAEALGNLNHPALVRHVAHGLTAQNQPYLASEWLDGENLGQRLARGRLAPDLAARLGARVLQALAAAHREGLVHGDLKPSNLFLPDQDAARVVVLDLGVGLCRPTARPLNHTGVITGPWYLTPEQVQGSVALDGRTDIFSLGCVLYECVTGRYLLAEDLWSSGFPPEGFAGRCVAVPQPLRAILERMLAVGRDDRADDAERLSSELSEVARVLEGIGTRFAIEVSPRGDFRVLFEKGPREPSPTLTGRAIPCFGRERELDLLESLWHEVCEKSVARAIIISAPAGGGKTRLRQELCERIKRNGPAFELLVGGGDPMRDGAPLSLLGPVLISATGLTGGEPATVKHQRLLAEIEHVLPPGQIQRVAAFLGEMAHIPFPEDPLCLRAARLYPQLMADQLRRAWIDWLEAMCSRRPVMLVLDDVHWGDSASVALAETALRVLHDKPLLLMALAQPEVDQRFMSLWRERAPQRIHLAPLSSRQSQRLVEYVAGPLPAATVRAMVERAQGNPLWLEELLRVVQGGGDIGQQRLETLLGTLQTRLHALDPGSKLILGACAVLGRGFHVDAIKAMVDSECHLDLERRLDLLEEQEILFSHASMVGQEFSFRHALVRQAAYEMLSRDERCMGHLWAGRFLEQMGESDACVLAEHFERGRDKLSAVYWLKRAAARALDADDMTGTLNLVNRALSLGAGEEDEKALRAIEAQIHAWNEEFCESERAARIAVSSEVAETRWRAISSLAAALTAEFKTEDLERLLASWAEPPKQPELNAHWLDCLLNALPSLVTAAGTPMRQRLQQGLEKLLENAPPDAPWVGHAESLRAHLAWAAGQPMQAQAGFARAAHHHARFDNRRAECEARAHLGQLLLYTGQLEKAEDTLRPPLEIAQRLELTLLSGKIAANLARVLAYRGIWDEARELGLRALSIAETHGSRRSQGEAEACLSLTEWQAGNYPSAEKFAIEAAASFELYPKGQSLAQALLARAQLGQGRTSEALQHARAAYDRLECPRTLGEGESTILLTMAECLLAVGDNRTAHQVLQRSSERLREWAETMTDPAVRRSFLTGLPEHVQLLQLCRLAHLEAPAMP
jgi:eukaryotic-like serine/threonine-protein kinase